MRHRKQKGKLSRDAAHRKALFMNLCREVIETLEARGLSLRAG